MAILLLALAAMLAPATASASTLIVHTFVQGKAGHPFRLSKGLASAGLTLTGTSNQTLTLSRKVFWSEPVSGSQAGGTGSVQWLPDGSQLVCTGNEVEELSAAGVSGWHFTSADDAGLQTPSWAWEFTDPETNRKVVLICDTGAGRVFAVDRADKSLVWEYTGTGAYRLSEPVCAKYVPDGTDGHPTVLVADEASAAPKVFEVRWGDYVKNAPNDGFSDESIVWHYGTSVGTGDGQLMGPTDVEREPGHLTLIADAAANRVIEVNRDDLTPKWQYGTGTTAGDLDDPLGAGLESNGDVVIADTGHGRVVEVGKGGSVVWSSSAGAALGQPRLAERVTGAPPQGVKADPIDGALLVCDPGAQHLALVGNTGGGNIDSTTLHLLSGASQAHWQSLRVDADRPSGTSVGAYYTPSSNVPSQEPFGLGTHSLRGVVSNTVRFNYWLTSTDLWVAPSLKDVVLTYTNGQTKANGSGNGGAIHGIGNAAGAGSGTGNGVGGSGNGSGVGAGQGTSSDLGGSGTAATSGKSSASQGASLAVPTTPQPAVSPAAGMPPGAITGTLVNVGELSGGARGGGGGSPPPRTSRAAALVGVSLTVLLVAALLSAPGLIVSRRMARLRSTYHPNELEGWG